MAQIHSQWQFGTAPNYLATLVLAGKKTATCSGKIFYSLENGDKYPVQDELHTILDSQNQPLVTIKLTEVTFNTLGKVSEAFAIAEGEGSLEEWKSAHQYFFSQQLNQPISDEFELVCERFEVVKIFSKTYQQWLTFAEQTLLENASQDPFLNAKADANILLQAVTKRSKSAIFAFAETELNESELRQLAELLVRRAKGEPMAYILGEKEFWSLPLAVSTATLIPRPDTERLVEVALEWTYKRLDTQEKLHILDLGTGTGAIALALASELGTKAEIIGVDKQPDAVKLAEKNRQTLGFENVRFLQSDWFEALKNQHFDLIVSNPPYIDKDDENLTQGDVRFEPLTALVAEQNGLSDLQKIIQNAPLYLTQNGALMLEHGWQQAASVQDIFQQNQWNAVTTFQDYGGNDRVTVAIWTT